MTTQIVVASSAYGLATVAAAGLDGLLPPADRRLLVVSHNTAAPEATPGPLQIHGADRLLDGFEAVHSYNAAIAPAHPSAWRPRPEDLPIWQRYLRLRWSIPSAEPVDLVCESIQVEPARALAQLFPDAAITVYADGLMSYGPTRNPLPDAVGVRIERLLYPDLVAGVTPVLLSEWGVAGQAVSTTALRTVLGRLDRAPAVIADAAPGSVAVVVGQYLAALGLLSAAEETRLHVTMIESAAAAGFHQVVFKAHPSAPSQAAELSAHARRLGVRLVSHAEPELVEPWFGRPGVGLVVGCFSTALATAARLYGLPVHSVGADLVLGRLAPVANSNRVPLVLAHRLFAEGSPPPEPPGVGRLVRAVAYGMQPDRVPGLRADALALAATDAGWLRTALPLSRRIGLGLSGPRWLHRLLRHLPRPVRRQLARWSARLPGLDGVERAVAR